MKVILRKDVEKLGKARDLLDVSEGHARNYLLPKNLAYIATPGNIKKLEDMIIVSNSGFSVTRTSSFLRLTFFMEKLYESSNKTTQVFRRRTVIFIFLSPVISVTVITQPVLGSSMMTILNLTD